MMQDQQHTYQIHLKQGDLYIELASDDVYFISQQMQQWFDVFFDETLVPIPISDSQLQALQQSIPEPQKEEASSAAVSTSPEPPVMPEPTVEEPTQTDFEETVDVLAAPAQEAVGYAFSEPDPEPASVEVEPSPHSFEQPVENQQEPVHTKPVPALDPEPEPQALPAFPDILTAQQQPVEKTMPAVQTLLDNEPAVSSEPAVVKGNDFEALMGSIMEDFQGAPAPVMTEESSQPAIAASENAPAIQMDEEPVLEASPAISMDDLYASEPVQQALFQEEPNESPVFDEPVMSEPVPSVVEEPTPVEEQDVMAQIAEDLYAHQEPPEQSVDTPSVTELAPEPPPSVVPEPVPPALEEAAPSVMPEPAASPVAPPRIAYDFGIPEEELDAELDPAVATLSLEALTLDPRKPFQAADTLFGEPESEEGEDEPIEAETPQAFDMAEAPRQAEPVPNISIDAVESLLELCELAPNASTGADFLLLSAYFLSHYKKEPKYSLKDLNAQLVSSGLTPVNHGILESVVAQNFVELVPDMTGDANAAEYTITQQGLEQAQTLLG